MTVFKVDACNHESVLYNFTNGKDGGRPLAGLIRDAAGNLYGTTALGGDFGGGTVFYDRDISNQETGDLTPSPAEAKEHFLRAGVIMDAAGELLRHGRVEAAPTMAGNRLEVSLHPFHALTNSPALFHRRKRRKNSSVGGLIRDVRPATLRHGTTAFGGPVGGGTVFKTDAANNFSVIYGFTGEYRRRESPRRSDHGRGRQPLRHDEAFMAFQRVRGPSLRSTLPTTNPSP